MTIDFLKEYSTADLSNELIVRYRDMEDQLGPPQMVKSPDLTVVKQLCKDYIEDIFDPFNPWPSAPNAEVFRDLLIAFYGKNIIERAQRQKAIKFGGIPEALKR